MTKKRDLDDLDRALIEEVKIKTDEENDNELNLAIDGLKDSFELQETAKREYYEDVLRQGSPFSSTPLIDEEVYKYLPRFYKRILDTKKGRVRDMNLLFLFGLISGALENVTLDYRDDRQNIPIFTYIVAPAGSGKGSCDELSAIIKQIHISRLQKYEELLKDWRSRARQAKKEKVDFDEPEPLMLKLFHSANTSAIALNRSLIYNNLVMFDSEGDTLGNCMKQDWGNMSDSIRKAFHNERIDVARKELGQIETDEPLLSIALCSTENQVRNIIKEHSDGLVSRFSFYRFEEKTKFHIPKESNIYSYDRRKGLLIESGNYFFDVHDREVKFYLSNEGVDFMNIWGGKDKDKFRSVADPYEIESLVNRSATQLVRIACLLQFFDECEKPDTPISKKERTPISMKFLELAERIMLPIFYCNFNTFLGLAQSARVETVNSKGMEFRLYSSLPDQFKTGRDSVFVRKSEELKLNPNTTKRWLTKWSQKGTIERVEKGVYKKLES